MSCDHYIAIHNTLYYTILMSQKFCFQIMMAFCITGIVVSLGIVIIVFNLSFYGSNIIQCFFGDITPVVFLAYDYTFF